jgi:hypothetical protein
MQHKLKRFATMLSTTKKAIARLKITKNKRRKFNE